MAIEYHKIAIAHGVLACVAWVIFFPVASILIRILKGPAAWKVHASIQVFGMALYTAAVGLGIEIARRFKLLGNYHVVIGLLIFSLMYLQAISGTIHHLIFRSRRRRSATSHAHLWLGRIIITFAMINGGLGLRITKRPHASKGQIAGYSVVTAVIWLVWVVTSTLHEFRRPAPGPSVDLDPKSQSTTKIRGRRGRDMSSKQKRALARERRLSQRRDASLAREKELHVPESPDSSTPVLGPTNV